ncbi:cytochrome c oxidase accessory protein CcoG [Azovibrio restrictus]|uniref:cytochrome c oxidase accessory protein CcoG n=1 Tax=Azovibrio restrictus TaxID=146938 RepID=UPI0026EA023C|nr:cytochrome c oxidase accessory protein CcoG [Azovibrio restrictus]MDD3481888.1 cytochrome c oxidase accessory protein CcoG [Azovibrio restrictus]
MNDNLENSTPAPEPDGGKTVSLYEKHKKIYIRSVTGWWATWRWIFVWGSQLLFYGLPWIQWNDRQAILFHLVERKFYLFGMVLWPQDVFYLAVLLIISAYGLFLFTAVAGRLFCGYACPQTVYTEIFMWIENKVEGERPARIKLDKGPRDARKIRLKAIKHAIWLLFSLWTGFTLVGYFTPMHELIGSLSTFSFGGWEIFWTLFYAGFTYMMAGFMREQVCKYMCPYARFQSVMFDPDTLVITYDQERGEPRGARKKNADVSKLGDCVDCGICVQVCPTGIDIRNGLQYECIGCGACIDGCDEVMDKVGMPRGLIRYTSENAMAKKYDRTGLMSHIVRPRIILYTVILILICIATAWSIATRVPLRADVIRDRSTLAREVEGGKIENVYTMKVMNVAESSRSFRISVTGLDGIELASQQRVEAGPAENREVTVNVRVPPEAAPKGSHKIFFDVVAEDDPKVAVHEKTTFLMP